MIEQQPQYFEVDAGARASASTPWWKTWKIAVVIGAVFVVAAAAVFIVNTVQLGRVSKERAAALSVMEEALAACRDASDPVQCADRVRKNAAQEGAGAKACDGISHAGLASCISLAAKEDGDVAACADLGGEDRTQCEDLAWFTVALEDVQFATCGEITNMRMATSCRLRVTSAATASGKCTESGVDASLCEARALLRDAIAMGTDAGCATLNTEERQAECREGIASQDNDGDGLVVRDEVQAGTSDEDSDSDDDGYTDGEEVANGFNPIE